MKEFHPSDRKRESERKREGNLLRMALIKHMTFFQDQQTHCLHMETSTAV